MTYINFKAIGIEVDNEDDRVLEHLKACPQCGRPWELWSSEDNPDEHGTICHAICFHCDITWSWDDEGFWEFDRKCVCGKPAVLNVSNGSYGCLDPKCGDYQHDGLDDDDYLISGYQLRWRPDDVEDPLEWDGVPGAYVIKAIYDLRNEDIQEHRRFCPQPVGRELKQGEFADPVNAAKRIEQLRRIPFLKDIWMEVQA